MDNNGLIQAFEKALSIYQEMIAEWTKDGSSAYSFKGNYAIAFAFGERPYVVVCNPGAHERLLSFYFPTLEYGEKFIELTKDFILELSFKNMFNERT